MTSQDQEHIIAFLRGELPKNRENDFLASLETDQELKQEFLIHKQLFDSLGPDSWSQASERNEQYHSLVAIAKSDQIKALKEVLKDSSAQQSTTSNWKIFKNWKLLSAAAVVLALVGIFSVFNAKPNYQDLFNQYSQQTSISSTIERGTSQDQIVTQIEMAYREQNFKNAISLSQSLDLNRVQNAAVLLYLGDSYLRLEAFKKALDVYDILIKSDLLDAPKGYWFKALAFLKMEDIDKTRQTLEYIVANNLYNASLAKELLSQL